MKADSSRVADLLEEPRTSRSLLLLVQLLYDDLCATAVWRARVAGAHTEASEIVHAAALRALRAWPGFRGRDARAFSSWLGFYLRSEIRRTRRLSGPGKHDKVLRHEEDRRAADPARRALLLDELAYLFGSLSPWPGQILSQSLLGFSPNEIARGAARSPLAVRKALWRIRSRLRTLCRSAVV